jgi:hypothetical protein
VVWRFKDDRLGGSAYTLACTRREFIHLLGIISRPSAFNPAQSQLEQSSESLQSSGDEMKFFFVQYTIAGLEPAAQCVILS